MNGCEYAQGYAFGEPMTAEAATALLSDKPARILPFPVKVVAAE